MLLALLSETCLCLAMMAQQLVLNSLDVVLLSEEL